MDRLERVRQVVDAILRDQPDVEERRAGFVHLYGVAAVCTLLALRRNLDSELCSAAGMLHDISSYKTGDPTDHAYLSALEAEMILREVDGFSIEEAAVVAYAISCHGAKDKTDEPMAEVLKDADVLQHYLYNPAIEAKRVSEMPEARAQARLARLNHVLEEVGLPQFEARA